MKKNTPVVCLFGMGTGLLAEKILNGLGEVGKLIIYEPTNIIKNYCIECAKCIGSDESEKKVGIRINKIINDKRTMIFYYEDEESQFINFIADKLDYRDLYGMVICINSGYGEFDQKKCLL